MIHKILNNQTSMLPKLRWCVFAAAAFILISFVILMGALRLVLPYLSSYETEIEKKLETTLGYPVRLSRIDAGWHWFSPQLKLVNVSVLKKDKKTQLVRFNEVIFEFNVIDNLFNFEFEPSVITLSGANIEINNKNERGYYVQGVSVSSLIDADSTSNDLETTVAKINGKELRFQDATVDWVDQRHVSKRQIYKNMNLSAQIDFPNFNLSVEADTPKNIGEKVALIAEVVLDDNDWLSDVYIMANSMQLESLMHYLKTPNFNVSSKLDSEIWLSFKNLKLTNASGKLSASGVEFHKKGKSDNIWMSEAITSSFYIKHNENEWDLVVDDLNVQLENRKWEDVYFSVRYKTNNNSINARFEYLELADISRLIVSLPIDKKVVTDIQSVNAKGELLKAEVQIDDWKKTKNWRLKSEFNNLGLTIPGEGVRLDGLSGSFVMDKNNGQIKLNSKSVTVDTKYFNEPLNLDHLVTEVEVGKNKEGFRVFSNAIRTKIETVEVLSRLKYESGKEEFLDLQVEFNGANARWLNKHRTDELFGKEVAQWLADAIVKGEFKSAGFIFHGLVNDFPFSSNEGVAQSIVKVDNGVLKYQPDWPAISNISARFVLENEEIKVDNASGRLGKSIINDSVTTINLAGELRAILVGKVDTNANEVEKFFTATPLKDEYLSLTQYLSVDGDLTTNLNIDIPLEVDEDVSVSGNVVLKDNAVTINGYGYSVSDAAGVVTFENDYIKAQKLSGTFNGKNLIANLGTKNTINGLMTTFQADLVSDVLSLIPMNKDVSHMFKGITNWDLGVDIYHSPKALSELLVINLKSDLNGLQVDVPEPFVKSHDQTQNFSVNYKVFDTSSAVLVHYDENLNLSMKWDDGFRNIHSDIRINNGPLKSIKEGVNVVAKLKKIDAKKWQNIFSLAFEGTSDNPTPEVNLHFDVGAVHYGQYELNDVVVKAGLFDDNWSLDIGSQEIVGLIEIPGNFSSSAALEMKLKKLDLTSILNDDVKMDTKQDIKKVPVSLFEPHNIPPLNIQASNFSFKNYKFNTMSLVSSRTSYGLTVHALDLKGDNLSLKVKGNWFSKGQAKDHSNFRIEIESDDVGKMFSFYDFTETIKGGSGKAIVDWQWAASPFDFDWKLVSGRMEANIAEGKFIDVEPGAGRILGMFSLRALPRRFLLDFSDTFTEGFEFDRFISHANFSQGNLYTSDTKLTGNAADIYFRGRIGLAAKDYDQTMSVVPRISSGISGWIAVAQGAVVGLTAYIGQKILGVDEAAKNQYRITGSWSEPVIKKVDDEETEIDIDGENEEL